MRKAPRLEDHHPSLGVPFYSTLGLKDADINTLVVTEAAALTEDDPIQYIGQLLSTICHEQRCHGQGLDFPPLLRAKHLSIPRYSLLGLRRVAILYQDLIASAVLTMST